MRLAADFQIMDAGWSVKQQRYCLRLASGLLALPFFA